MGKGGSPWQDGRRAWERLNGWHQDKAASVPGHPDDGDGALDALGDVGMVRRLLDQAELVAVRTARRHGKSWAEIATRLGVTRQSAWERWRDLDEAAVSRPAEESAPQERDLDDAAVSRPAEESAPQEHALDLVAAAVAEDAWVRVPNVVGKAWDDARRMLDQAGLVAVGPYPDGPPLAELGWPDGVVTDQSPEPGSKAPPGSPVRLWVERGGGSGVREPRRPKPNPATGYAMRNEESEEAVG